ncbi:MAG TPA: DmsC/YnfH family molybdoenzyme membrane anchor subunit [Burkholderiaceae bacterium]|nr:DmsC/YnfH family molybdoenzyme membrane anchor subunit [Burkholderiaceae bacterium]
MSGPDHLAPRRQSNWDWRASANFICGGCGGALLVWTACATLAGADLRAFVIAALALIGVGLTCVWFELGRRWRAINVLRHGATSWMTREAIVATLLFCCGAIALAGPHQKLAVSASGVLGLAFLYSQARILAANKGIPAWRHRLCPPLVLATGLVEGAGLLTPLTLSMRSALIALSALLALLAAARLLAWRRYLLALQRDGAPAGAIAELRAINPELTWAGGAVPVVLALLASAISQPLLLLLAGAFVVFTGARLKYTLICRASFVQGFALPRVPVRGAGVTAPGVQPGWERSQFNTRDQLRNSELA